MKTALGELLDAVQHERKRIMAEIESHQAQITAKREELKRYDKVIAASGAEPEVVAKQKKKNTNDWQVGTTKIDLVYRTMAEQENGDGPISEYSTAELAEKAGLSRETVVRAVNALHAQGRVRLVRKEGLAKIWAVVT